MHRYLQLTGRVLVGSALAAGLALACTGAAEAAPRAGLLKYVTGPTSDAGKSSIAKCPAGTSVVNGGYSVTATHDPNGAQDIVVVNRPVQNGTAWEVKMKRGRAIAYAICLTD
ncbi:hypothetical protein [Actinosynnema sp. NPDC020468]|uniref:hypothetical protein n=1 Tax=Actinosynnema sp. NPDC020468 TaxID=3154488 RepID=UPI00340C35CC